MGPSESETQADVIDLAMPITTSRLRLRSACPDDAVPLHARRNEPVAAKFQSWPIPYPMESARELMVEVMATAGPTLGEWWMAIVDLPGIDGQMDQVIGDVAVHLDESGTIAEVGYTFASEHWGKGYASEAVGAVIDRLFSRHPEMVRVQAQMHPDNHASAGVAERCGLLYEGQTKLSFIPSPEDTGSQERSDNLIYGVIRDDWDQWQRRPTDAPDQVRLVELSNSNLDQVERLTTHKSQERMVAPVLVSIAQAFVPPVYDGALIKPWHRVVEADGQIVGFVMLATSDKSDRSPYLWRFLIDRGHQRRGIGGQVLDLIVDEVRRWRAERLFVSWVPGTGSPERFYRRHGFIPTGKIDESGEVEGVLRIH